MEPFKIPALYVKKLYWYTIETEDNKSFHALRTDWATCRYTSTDAYPISIILKKEEGKWYTKTDTWKEVKGDDLLGEIIEGIEVELRKNKD